MQRLTLLIAAAALMLGGGCGVESEYVNTAGIWAHFHVEHQVSDVVVARAEMSVGQGIDGNPLDLTGGDELDCNGVRLHHDLDLVNLAYYSVVVPVAADGRYQFTLSRPGESITSEVQTPAVPTIVDFDPPDVLAIDGDLTVLWDVSEPGVSVNVWADGPCVATRSDLGVPDDGEHVFVAVAARDPQAPTSCPVDLVVVRNGRGEVSPDFLGGYGSSTIASEVYGPTFTP